jgi:predicted transcriptional regulator
MTPRGRPTVPEDRIRTMRDLRSRGMTWEQIGRLYGVTRQAASQAVKRAAARDAKKVEKS